MRWITSTNSFTSLLAADLLSQRMPNEPANGTVWSMAKATQLTTGKSALI
jgi:hypothetical protein